MSPLVEQNTRADADFLLGARSYNVNSLTLQLHGILNFNILSSLICWERNIVAPRLNLTEEAGRICQWGP